MGAMSLQLFLALSWFVTLQVSAMPSLTGSQEMFIKGASKSEEVDADAVELEKLLLELLDPTEVIPVEVSPEEVSPVEVNSEEMSPGEVSPGEVSTVEVSPGEVSPGEVSPEEVSPGEVSTVEVSPGEVSPGEVSPGEVSPEEVSPVEVSPVEVNPEEFKLEEIDSQEVSPEDVNIEEIYDSALYSSCMEQVARLSLAEMLEGYYYFYTDDSGPRRDWYQARDWCSERGMALVDLDTTDESEAIISKVANILASESDETSFFWTGGNTPSESVHSRRQSSSSNSHTNDASSSNEACKNLIKIDNTVKLNDRSCTGSEGRFICEVINPCLNIFKTSKKMKIYNPLNFEPVLSGVENNNNNIYSDVDTVKNNSSNSRSDNQNGTLIENLLNNISGVIEESRIESEEIMDNSSAISIFQPEYWSEVSTHIKNKMNKIGEVFNTFGEDLAENWRKVENYTYQMFSPQDSSEQGENQLVELTNLNIRESSESSSSNSNRKSKSSKSSSSNSNRKSRSSKSSSSFKSRSSNSDYDSSFFSSSETSKSRSNLFFDASISMSSDSSDSSDSSELRDDSSSSKKDSNEGKKKPWYLESDSFSI